MRLRPVKNAAERIAGHPEVITTIDRNETKRLDVVFTGGRPLHLEIGAGKGRFAHTLASRRPDIDCIAVEKYDYAIVKALDKVLSAPLENLHLVRMDAEKITDCLDPSSIAVIHLNFSDPWPKARHEKRRLTHPRFLKRFKTLLEPGGTVEFKTDNRVFFEYSLLTLQHAGFMFEDVCLDLHHEDEADRDNIMTEFEEKYGKDGPVYKIRVRYEGEKT